MSSCGFSKKSPPFLSRPPLKKTENKKNCQTSQKTECSNSNDIKLYEINKKCQPNPYLHHSVVSLRAIPLIYYNSRESLTSNDLFSLNMFKADKTQFLIF